MRLSISRSCALAVSLTLAVVACGGESSNAEAGSTAEIKTAKGANKVTTCHGAEPFWGITIDDKTVKWENAGQTRTIENRGPQPAVNSSVELASLYQGRTTEDPNRFLNVIIKEAEGGGCSHTAMEEGDTLPYEVTILSGTELLFGCCQ